jgi:hypothetical protein
MHECFPLIDQIVLSVKDLGVPCIDDVLDDESAVGHLVLPLSPLNSAGGHVIFKLTLAHPTFTVDHGLLLFVVIKHLSFVDVDLHHVGFADLVEAVAKFG